MVDAASLCAALIDPAQSSDGIRNGLSLRYGQAHGLFAVDILAGPCRQNRDARVPVVPRRHIHGIDVFARDQLQEVAVGLAIVVSVMGIHCMLSIFINYIRTVAG